jgi:hypothetical protein
MIHREPEPRTHGLVLIHSDHAPSWGHAGRLHVDLRPDKPKIIRPYDAQVKDSLQKNRQCTFSVVYFARRPHWGDEKPLIVAQLLLLAWTVLMLLEG